MKRPRKPTKPNALRQRLVKRVQTLQREHTKIGHNCDQCRVFERVLLALEKP